MKKVVIAAFTLVTLGVVSANAQTEQAPTQTAPAATQSAPAENQPAQTAPAATSGTEDKTAVKLEELPEPVKTTLASPSLKDWTPTEAFLVKTGDGKEYYAINIKKEDEAGSVKLDKEGKPVQ
jgi:hypothetical protein